MPVGNHNNTNTNTNTTATTPYTEAYLETTDEDLRRGLREAVTRQGMDEIPVDDDEWVKWARQPIVMRVTKYADLYGSFWELNCPSNVTELVNHYNAGNNVTELKERALSTEEFLYYPNDHFISRPARDVKDQSSYFSDTIWLTYSDFTFVTVRQTFCIWARLSC